MSERKTLLAEVALHDPGSLDLLVLLARIGD